MDCFYGLTTQKSKNS